MRRPEKATRVYELLRNRIFEHKYIQGELLPKEVDLARELGVSRETLRHSLDMLAAESLVYRVRGCGTFVSEGSSQKELVFLLPTNGRDFTSNAYLEEVFRGVLRAGGDYSCRVETIAVSPSNDIEDIDWKCLFNLNRRSRVVVMGLWFKPLFPFLLEKGCRVAVVHDETKDDHSLMSDYSSWYWLTKANFDICRRLVQELYRQGSRRPLFGLKFLDDPVSGFRENLEKVWSEIYAEESPCLVSLPDTESDEGRIEERLRSAMSEYECDGFLLNCPYTYQIVRRLYPDLPCGMINLRQYPLIHSGKHVFYSEMPLEKMGYKAAELLLQDSIMSAHLLYKGEIVQGCQSDNKRSIR